MDARHAYRDGIDVKKDPVEAFKMLAVRHASQSRDNGYGVHADGAEMTGIKIAAIVLIVAGVLGLAYGSFSYARETHAKVGPLEFSVQEKETVNIPVWAGSGAVAGGAALLLSGNKKR